MPHERVEHGGSGGPPKAGVILAKINSDIRALNSSILIISQKMRYLVRNEKILGRNLLVLNKKLRDFEGNGGATSPGNGTISEPLSNEIAKVNESLSDVSNQLAGLRSRIEEISETYAKAGEVKEIKYVIDAIDPQQFVTRNDLKELTGLKAKEKTVPRHAPKEKQKFFSKQKSKAKK